MVSLCVRLCGVVLVQVSQEESQLKVYTRLVEQWLVAYFLTLTSIDLLQWCGRLACISFLAEAVISFLIPHELMQDRVLHG